MSELNIVIPMAGRGSRFAEAGYTTPKPMIPIHGVPMIKIVVNNITPDRECCYVFIVLREHAKAYGIDRDLQELVPGCEIVYVDEVTEGAACTVLLAREYIDSDVPLMLANSDQFVDIDMKAYLARQEEQDLDGLIMTFWADDPKWSYCRLDAEGLVTEVLEKQVVSTEATVGIYNFRRGADFVAAADRMIAAEKRVNGEFYVAPAYNELIEQGGRVGIFNIGEEGRQMHGLGVPTDLDAFAGRPEYRELIRSWA
jgi:NDP-sugar pyrophosphorylase family protein